MPIHLKTMQDHLCSTGRITGERGYPRFYDDDAKFNEKDGFGLFYKEPDLNTDYTLLETQ